MFKNKKEFKESLRILINHETKNLDDYTSKEIEGLEKDIETNINYFTRLLQNSYKIAECNHHYNKIA